MIRFVVFLLSLCAAAYSGHALTPKVPFPPTLVEITTCAPKAVAGYVLILPDGYVGGISSLSPEDRKRADEFKASGELRLGSIHFKGPNTCPGV